MMRDYKISQATAYREHNWAMQIFGDLDAVSVKADRLILQVPKKPKEKEKKNKIKIHRDENNIRF